MNSTNEKPLISAALGRQPARYPAWFLRQAGRYLPEYQKIRSQFSFLDLCRNAQKAAEVTLQPLQRFDLDAAIIFSDILIPAAYMGLELSFDKGHGPILREPVRCAKDLKNLKLPDWEKDAPFTGNAISEAKKGLLPHQSMIGFAGAPFTVACYMIEGRGTKSFSEVKKLLFSRPEAFKDLLTILADTTLGYLCMQVRAGADALMLFDTWAGNLFAGDYRNLVAPVMVALSREIKKLGVPLILYPGQGGDILYELGSIAADVIAVDWRAPLGRALTALKQTGSPFRCLQGNLDPQLLSWASEGLLREEVRRIKAQAREVPAHIFNVGHGVLPTTSPLLVQAALDELRKPEG